MPVRGPQMFRFNQLVDDYYRRATDDEYARLRGWEFLWDHLQSMNSWKSIASPRNLETSALHLGFYLANWGMFRGSSKLLNVNLEFFKKLTARLFNEIDTEVWNLALSDFTEDNQEAVRAFDEALIMIRSFGEGRVSWTETLITKILLGVWGECPARDQYFNKGFSSFLENRDYGRQPSTSGRYFVYLNRIRVSERWELPAIRTQAGNDYAPGKLIDMAFFQYGEAVA